MKTFIIYHLTEWWYAVTSPFIYWFGENWLFIELWALGSELVDTVGIFGTVGIVVLFALGLRNFIFQVLPRIFNKKNLKNLNFLPLFNYNKSLWSTFKLFILTLKNKIRRK